MAVSNVLLGILNFLTALLSIPILGAGIWLATKAHTTDCMRFLQWPVIIIGLFVLLVSLAGLVASFRRVTLLLGVYAAVMLLLIVLLLCVTLFAFVVTYKGAGDAVSGKGFKEYHLDNYSTWLQKQVNKASNWDKIKSCLADSKICSRLDHDYSTPVSFASADLSPIQSGCCKPPTACNFTFLSPTNWTAVNEDAMGVDTVDCQAWSDDASQLCYDCSSCKAGVLQNVKQSWRMVALINAIVLVFLIILFSVACCALRSARRSRKYYIKYNLPNQSSSSPVRTSGEYYIKYNMPNQSSSSPVRTSGEYYIKHNMPNQSSSSPVRTSGKYYIKHNMPNQSSSPVVILSQ